MATMTFGEAMAGFSDVLYTRAKENMADQRQHLLHAPGEQAHARATVTFDVTLGKGGLVSLDVNRYCAGFTLRCSAAFVSQNATPVVSGYIHSSDGGGAEFSHVRMDQRVQFELKTSFWRSTVFGLHLRTTPALPEGTVLQVCMDIGY
ncbi:hypothetical protein [Hyalangium versicolor]|uniref:hypothetical protein n=1 Tax=Hyalangium versicolor TaxID=2861190 RepID=UPI001CC93571|nr:hypothetical protein [Hyalangium versicolor]